MGLSDVQIHLLSYFNMVKIVPLKSTLQIFEEILQTLNNNKTPNHENLLEEIHAINSTIRQYELEIKEATDEITCEKLLILINLVDNIMARKSGFYSENVTKMFSEIIKECIYSKEGYISETHCLNLSIRVKTSKTRTMSIIETLVEDKWIVLKDGLISLGMRTIIEMEPIIKQLYSDEIRTCPFCKLMVIQGYICKNCDIRCHNYCMKKHSARAKGKCVCPNCKEVWKDITNQNDTHENCFDVDRASSSGIFAKRRKTLLP